MKALHGMAKVLLGLTLLLFASTVVLTGCSETKRTEAEHVQRAKDYMDKEEHRAAIIELKNALQQNANNAEARWLLGQIYLTLKNGALAEKELARARELGVSEEAVRTLLADALLMQRRFRKVLDQVEVPPAAEPGELARILRVRGEAKLGLGNVDSGCALFLQAKDSDPGYAPAHVGLAKCAIVREKLDDARTHLETALEIDPDHAKSWLLLGRLERSEGNPEAARTAFEKAIEADQYEILARLEHANITLALDDLDAFRDDLAIVRKSHPHHFVTDFLQAMLDIREGNAEGARTHLQEAVKRNPKHLPAQVLLGAVELDLDAPVSAQSILGRALTEAPDSPLIRRLLARAQLRGGQMDRALETLQPLISVKKPTPEDLTLAGEAYLRLGDVDRAKEIFALAQTHDPDSAGTQVNLARARLAAGEWGQALQSLDAAVNIDPKRTSTLLLQAITHLSVKDYASTLEAAERLEEQSPDSVFASHIRGLAYAGKREWEAARQALERALAIEPGYMAARLALADIDLVQGKSGAARTRLEEAAKDAPGDYRPRLALARLAHQQGRGPEARSWVVKAVEADPDAVEPREILVQQLVNAGKIQQALSAATEGAQRNPRSPAALNLLGATQLSAGNTENAIATFEHLTALQPRAAGTHYRLGLTLLAVGRYDEGRKALTEALRLAPESLQVKATLATLENQAGRYDEAIRIAREIQKTHPEQPTGFVSEGDALLKQGHTEKAVSLYEKALATAEDTKTLIRIVRALDALGRDKEAQDRLLEWIEAHPEDTGTRMFLAARYQRAGELGHARKQYEVLVDQEPENPFVLNNLANLYQKTHDARALETARRAVALQPDHPVFLDTLGWILVRQGEVTQGLDLLQEAVGKLPGNKEIRYHRAYALAQAGKKSEAKEELEALLAGGSFPQEQEARHLLERL